MIPERMHNVWGMHSFRVKSARRWAKFVRVATRGDSQGAIARRTGINQTTISRWLASDNRHHPDARSAVHLARSYNVDPLRALVELGLLSDEEAQRTERPDALSFTTKELLDELARRNSESAA